VSGSGMADHSGIVNGQRGWSALLRWRGRDGLECPLAHHVASSRDEEARASPSTRGCVTLVDGFLKNSIQ
jgi:hypothetical protein